MEITLFLLIVIFGFNIFFHHPVLNSFLFALALAVGLTPQLLPAIISVNLAHGAKQMAKKRVIVKRLASLENFGSMNIFCADKTGTLTEGIIQVRSAINAEGKEEEKVFLYAYLNAFYQTGYTNPIDSAIVKSCKNEKIDSFTKLDEIPYDFLRKRVSLLFEEGATPSKEKKSSLMITKGAVSEIFKICKQAELSAQNIVAFHTVFEKLQSHYEELSNAGFRVLAIAYRHLQDKVEIKREDEEQMIFLGFLVLHDPLKKEIAGTIEHLKNIGVSLKIITGDNHFVAHQIAGEIGMKDSKIILGSDLHQMSDKQISDAKVFAEIEPNQKEQIILALKKRGHVVGFMGDGINDASALHAADVAISVSSAVDVAKETADIVLLDKDLSVLFQGVYEGRRTFANTMKYIFMATSANFGNMFSMAGASLFLNFFPLLPKQILMTNLLTDLPEMTIATDNIDEELIKKPLKMNIKFIAKFMIVFGLLSSIFDYLTFAALLFIFHASPEEFRTAWFLESVASASFIVLVIRSRRPFFKSKPSHYLAASIVFCIGLTFLIPYTSLGSLFGFTALRFSYFMMIGMILLFYIFFAEVVKKIFYKKVKL